MNSTGRVVRAVRIPREIFSIFGLDEAFPPVSSIHAQCNYAQETGRLASRLSGSEA